MTKDINLIFKLFLFYFSLHTKTIVFITNCFVQCRQCRKMVTMVTMLPFSTVLISTLLIIRTFTYIFQYNINFFCIVDSNIFNILVFFCPISGFFLSLFVGNKINIFFYVYIVLDKVFCVLFSKINVGLFVTIQW